ncbi:MAG: protein kinase [Deltaproteobacteria bacterium]|nr:protein kinase [Deltaproteobacteria bacterium]
MDRTGQTLENKYTLLRLVGEGGMGTVYEARHALIHRRCAVKFLHAEAARDADQVKRFIREAQAASAVAHPGIVDVYDVGVAADGVPYLVMELLDGENLAACLERAGRLPVADAVEIVVAALAALAAAHRAGIVHRDLKPGNLFLERGDVPGRRVKILDFGISRVTAADDPRTRMTRTGAVLGTPCYMAPEQAGGLRDVDHRLDLYAMGVILYECLTGRLPFEADNYNRLIVMICSEPFPRPGEVAPGIPEGLEAAILNAMARRREDRYADADGMIRALTPFLAPDAAVRLGLASTPAPAPSSASFPAFSIAPSAPAPPPPGESRPVPPLVSSGPGTETSLHPPSPIVAGTTTLGDRAPRRSSRARLLAAGVAVVVALAVAAAFLVRRNSVDDDARPVPPSDPAGAGLAAARMAAAPGSDLPNIPGTPSSPAPSSPLGSPASLGAPAVSPAAPSSEPESVAATPPAADRSGGWAGGADAGSAAAAAGPGAGSPIPAGVPAPTGRPDASARRDAGSAGPAGRADAFPPAPLGTPPPPRSDAAVATAPASLDTAGEPPSAIAGVTSAARAVGYLTVRALPRSDVYLDGRHLGATPVARTEVPAGPHTLRLVPRADSVAPGETKAEQIISVTVAEGATENVVRYY